MNSKDFWNSDYWLEDVIFILSRIKERCQELYFKGEVVGFNFFLRNRNCKRYFKRQGSELGTV